MPGLKLSGGRLNRNPLKLPEEGEAIVEVNFIEEGQHGGQPEEFRFAEPRRGQFLYFGRAENPGTMIIYAAICIAYSN